MAVQTRDKRITQVLVSSPKNGGAMMHCTLVLDNHFAYKYNKTPGWLCALCDSPLKQIEIGKSCGGTYKYHDQTVDPPEYKSEPCEAVIVGVAEETFKIDID